MRIVVMCAAVVAISSPVLATEKLAGDELKQTVSGKQVFLATPFGGEFPLSYKSNGTVDGTGKAVGLGKYMQPTDSGRWWVDGDQLCQKWKSWYNGKQFCFTIKSEGEKKISWTRDDGLSGVARITD